MNKVIPSNSELLSKECKKLANKISRNAGYGCATGVVFGEENRLIERVRPGYRKKTTGQYVPNAYLNNFGWKNTYYQHAVNIVEIKI